MLKFLIIPASAATLVVGHFAQDGAHSAAPEQPMVQMEVDELLDASRGVSPMLCWFAAEGVSGGGTARLIGVPHPPIGREESRRAARILRDSLGSQGRDRVRQGLRSSDRCEREIATRLIGREGREFHSSEVRGLITELFNEQISPSRISAAIVAGLTEARHALHALHQALTDNEVEVRANSAWALGRLRDHESVEPLSRALRDTDPSVRAASVVSLHRLGADDALLLRILREDRSPEVRRTAAWALQRSRTTEAVDALAEALRRDADEGVREMAAWALGHARTQGAAEALSAAVQNDQSRTVRATAAWGVGNIAPRRLPAGLLAGLTDSDREVRLRAAWAAGQSRDPESLAAVQRAFDAERDDRVRSAMVRALILTGGRDTRMVEGLLGSEDEEVRRRAIMALAGRGAPWPWPWPWPRPYP